MVMASFKPSKQKIKAQQEYVKDMNRTLNSLEAVKMLSLYVLRNQGWGRDRLKRFNDKWNEYAVDIANGYFSLSDIAKVLEDECGLTLDDLKINVW